VRAAEAGIEVDAGRLAGLYGQLDVRPRMVERVRSLRAEGYRTAIVTNNVREASDTWRAKLPLDELFDAVVDSCEVGMRKPNPAIYLHALALLDVPPARAVFLDDVLGCVG
jgi:putative hydrolase of the HAD superfamily